MEATVTLERMSTEEARACVDQIKSNLENVRARLFDLREREGWRALGYETWQACIQAEFHMSERHAHRLLNAHRVDQILAPPWQESTAVFGRNATPEPDRPMGQAAMPTAPLPERHARELEPLVAEPDAVREVYAEVQERTAGKPTAAAIRAVVDERLGVDRPEPSYLPPPESAPAPFVMPEREEETEEERAYFTLSRQRLIARYVPGLVAATPADPVAALPAWEEFEAWFKEFMVVLRARATHPIRLAR